MKTLNKVVGGLLLAFGLTAVVCVNSRASVVARAPKHVYTLNYTTVISSVTPFTVAQATTTLQPQPGAIYQLNLSTGASGDYLIFFDTIPFSAGALTATGTANNVYQLGPRFYYGSTTANTQITFDPPLEFYNGLMVINSSTAEQAGISYEVGRGLSGQ